MRVMSLACSVAIVTASTLATAGTVYTDVGDFTSAAATVVLNDFSTVSNGFYNSLTFEPPAFQTFAYTISANSGLIVGPTGTAIFLPSGAISTSNGSDALQISFATNNVYAVGGDFWGTGLFGQSVLSTITIALSNGHSVQFTTFGPEFRGFTSNVAISSITIDADRTLFPNLEAWATMDNFYVGTAIVPLPPAAWAGLGLLGLLGGVRAVRRRG